MLKISGLKFNNTKIQQKLKKRFESKANLAVGFIDGSTYSDGEGVANVAFRNNYGSFNIPARPFFDIAIAENTKKWFQTFQNAMQDGNDTAKALAITGTVIKDDVSQSIIDYNEVPNAPLTIKLKGSSNPLVDTGFMASSVTYKVTE